MSEPYFHSFTATLYWRTSLPVSTTGGNLYRQESWKALKRASASSVTLIAGLLPWVLAASSWISMLLTAPLHFSHLILHICTVVIYSLCLVDLCHFRCWKLAGTALRENSCIIIWIEGWLTFPGHETTERRGVGGGGGERRSESSGRTASLHSLTDTFSPSSPSLSHLKWPVVSVSWSSLNEEVDLLSWKGQRGLKAHWSQQLQYSC